MKAIVGKASVDGAWRDAFPEQLLVLLMYGPVPAEVIPVAATGKNRKAGSAIPEKNGKNPSTICSLL